MNKNEYICEKNEILVVLSVGTNGKLLLFYSAYNFPKFITFSFFPDLIQTLTRLLL